MTALIDSDELRRTCDILLTDAWPVELRALKGVKLAGEYRSFNAASGYFDNTDDLLAEAGKLQDASGLYFTLNEIPTELAARSYNTIKGGAIATSDDAVTRRRWFFVDLDPNRPSGTSSTDEEKQLAFAVLTDVDSELHDAGWPAPIIADSGNGYHLLYRIDLPNDDESEALVKRCLQAIEAKHATDDVGVDLTVSNAGRICKLYGSRSAKGSDAKALGRPHRMSRIVQQPETLDVVGRDLLEQLAAQAPVDNPALPAKTTTESFRSDDFIGAFMQRHFPDAAEKPHKGGRKWILAECPFQPEHAAGEATVIEYKNGAIGAGCQHDSCKWGWRDLRERCDPGCYDPKPAAEREQAAIDSTKAAPPKFTELISWEDLAKMDFRPNFIVDDVINEGEPGVIGGRSKTLKTSIAIDLFVSLSTGTPFLGRFRCERKKVAMWSGESGRNRIIRQANAIADARGIADKSGLYLSPYLPRLSDRNTFSTWPI